MRDKEKQHAAQHRWYEEVVKPRKAKWFEENGPCKKCGGEENLELHHKDPTQKESHRIWSWKAERRLVELAKCIVLCSECHDLVHIRACPAGTLWCYDCKQFVPIENFGRLKSSGRRGYRWQCNPCRKKSKWV